MKKNILNLFKKNIETQKAEKKEGATVNTDFVKSISFEENPFENEIPADTKVYDIDGNEVKQ